MFLQWCGCYLKSRSFVFESMHCLHDFRQVVQTRVPLVPAMEYMYDSTVSACILGIDL